MAGPAHHGWNPERPLPVGILFVSEGSRGGIGPGVLVWPVVRTVKNKSVVGDAKLIKQRQKLAYILIVINHHVVILGLPPSCLEDALWLFVRAKMHVRSVNPDKERFSR